MVCYMLTVKYPIFSQLEPDMQLTILFCLFLTRGEPFDRGLVHSIESVIIEWTHQIQSVLKRNSAQSLIEGRNPGPLVELDFWRARANNLECIFEQVSAFKSEK